MREGSLSGQAVMADGRTAGLAGRQAVPLAAGCRRSVFLFAGWGLVNLTGLGLFWWIGPLFVYLSIPPSTSSSATTPATRRRRSSPGWTRTGTTAGVTYLFLPAQYAALVVGFWLMRCHGGLSSVDRLGIAFTLGSLNGVAINTAHELGHKKEHLERWFARIALAPTVTGTSSSSTTAATTCGSRPRRTRLRAGSASRSGPSCRAPSRQPAQLLAPGAHPAAPHGHARTWRCATTCSTRGR